MDKEYKEIERIINEQALSFSLYLRTFILDTDTWNILLWLTKTAKVYIFSGVIRNFFLGYYVNRDLDIVIDSKDKINIPIKYLREFKWTRNSFGGLKIKINNLKIDFWYLKDTWGIKKQHISFNAESLINTCFFNFSAIVFDVNENKFIYKYPFLQFLKYNCMDIVYPINPNVPLCIVNIIYYNDKYSFNLSYDLCRWFRDNFEDDYDYRPVQIHHWNIIRYDNSYIRKFYETCAKIIYLY